MKLCWPLNLSCRFPAAAEQLQSNQQKLVTGIDVFTTLNHLLNWDDKGSNSLNGAAANRTLEAKELAAWAKRGGCARALPEGLFSRAGINQR